MSLLASFNPLLKSLQSTISIGQRSKLLKPETVSSYLKTTKVVAPRSIPQNMRETVSDLRYSAHVDLLSCLFTAFRQVFSGALTSTPRIYSPSPARKARRAAARQARGTTPIYPLGAHRARRVPPPNGIRRVPARCSHIRAIGESGARGCRGA